MCSGNIISPVGVYGHRQRTDHSTNPTTPEQPPTLTPDHLTTMQICQANPAKTILKQEPATGRVSTQRVTYSHKHFSPCSLRTQCATFTTLSSPVDGIKFLNISEREHHACLIVNRNMFPCPPVNGALDGCDSINCNQDSWLYSTHCRPSSILSR